MFSILSKSPTVGLVSWEEAYLLWEEKKMKSLLFLIAAEKIKELLKPRIILPVLKQSWIFLFFLLFMPVLMKRRALMISSWSGWTGYLLESTDDDVILNF